MMLCHNGLCIRRIVANGCTADGLAPNGASDDLVQTAEFIGDCATGLAIVRILLTFVNATKYPMTCENSNPL